MKTTGTFIKGRLIVMLLFAALALIIGGEAAMWLLLGLACIAIVASWLYH